MVRFNFTFPHELGDVPFGHCKGHRLCTHLKGYLPVRDPHHMARALVWIVRVIACAHVRWGEENRYQLSLVKFHHLLFH